MMVNYYLISSTRKLLHQNTRHKFNYDSLNLNKSTNPEIQQESMMEIIRFPLSGLVPHNKCKRPRGLPNAFLDSSTSHRPSTALSPSKSVPDYACPATELWYQCAAGIYMAPIASSINQTDNTQLPGY